MEILTNKVEIVDDNIDSRFDIYLLIIKLDRSKKDLFGNVEKLIDSLDNKNIYSVYRNGSKFRFYFLVEKGMNKLKINDLFDKDILQYFLDYNLIRYFDYDKFASVDDKLNLLLNSIKDYNFNNEKYECFDGKLYEIIKSKKDYLIALKYSFQDMCLKADVVTFRKCDNYNKDKRVFHIQEKYLVKNSNKTCGYIIEGEKNKKHNLNYFSGKSLSALEESKIFRIIKMYEKFNQVYKRLCLIRFTLDEMQEIKFDSITLKQKSHKKKALEIVKNIGINIIDNVFCLELQNKIMHYFDSKNINYSFSNEIDRHKLNLNIIHSKSYYENNCLKDKYIKNLDFVVQNIIYDDSSRDNEITMSYIDKNKIEVIISELVHKFELHQKKILHHDYDNLIVKKFIFGRVKHIESSRYLRCELEVENGSMIFKHFCEDNSYLKECIYLKEKYTGNIYEISVLSKYPLTEINKLKDAYDETSKIVDVQNDLIPILNDYKQNNKYIMIIDEILTYLKRFNDIRMNVLYDEIKKNLYPENNEIRKEYSNCLKDLNKYLWMKKYKNIYFRPLWRGKDEPIKKTFEKFKYRYDDNDGFEYYSACCNSLNESIYNGFPYRKIKYTFTEMEIKDYIKLLDVDDIRNNQNTVIPYPFKYITEYINIINKSF